MVMGRGQTGFGPAVPKKVKIIYREGLYEG